MVWLILSVAIASSNACDALCRRDGYSLGSPYKKGCLCSDVKEDLEGYITRSQNIGPQPATPFIPSGKSSDVRVIFNREKEEFEY